MPYEMPNSPDLRVNIRALVNSSAIRREKRNGKDYIIVPSATLPDDVVMNGIKYPADEIEKSYKTLDRTFAPLGHPMIGNSYISALEPEAVNDFYVGAHNENVRREKGRVWLDKAIDVEVAKRTERGRALLEAIDKGEPIHTSTGVYLEVEESKDPGFSKIARNLYFDHDAILIGEEGAATPSQGVGMMVNRAARVGSKSLLVVNSTVSDPYEDEVAWAARHLLETVRRSEEAKQSQGLLDDFIQSVKKLFRTESKKPEGNLDPINNGRGENTMPVSDENFKALEDQVKNLAANVEKVAQSMTEAVALAMKPVTAQLDAITANEKAKEEAERVALSAVIVANKSLGLAEADLKDMPVAALRKLAGNQAPGTAAPILAGNRGPDDKDPWAEYQFPTGEEK